MEEIATLSYNSQLLVVFLLKKRGTDRNRELAIRFDTILDTQEVYNCAIEQGFHGLLYLNHKTRQLAPKAETSMTLLRRVFPSGNAL